MKRAYPQEALAPDAGLSVAELAVASALSLIVLAAVGAGLYNAARVGRASERQKDAINSGRVAAAQLQRDVRNAQIVQSCDVGGPSGSCLRIISQHPNGSLNRITWRVPSTNASELYRDADCDPAFLGCTTKLMLDNLANASTSTALFQCSGSSTTFPQVNIVMSLYKLSGTSGSGTLFLQTSARPRSISGATTSALC